MLNYEYPPLGGGAGNATAHLLREFSEIGGVSVDLVTSSTRARRVEDLFPNVTAHFLNIGKSGNIHYQTNRDLLTYSWKAWRYARRLVQRNRYDLCHAFFGIPCGYIARRLGLPYVVSLRGSDVPFYNSRFAWPDRLIFQRMSRRIWRDSKGVVANSDGLRNLALETAPHQEIGVIPNGVDTEFFRSAPRSGDGLNVVCVSRLIARKGLGDLIRAVSLVGDPDVRLLLAGSGNRRLDLQKLARNLGVADRVAFLGFVPHEEINRVYREGDLFVLPSLNEGMSNTVLEAMACGLPVVMTDTGGARELIRRGENGFLVPHRSPRAIADRIRYYRDHPAKRDEHGAESRRRAEEMNWRRVAEAYLRLYRDVAREGD